MGMSFGINQTLMPLVVKKSSRSTSSALSIVSSVIIASWKKCSPRIASRSWILPKLLLERWTSADQWAGADGPGDPKGCPLPDDEIGDVLGISVHADQQDLPPEVSTEVDIENQMHHHATGQDQSQASDQYTDDELAEVKQDNRLVERASDPEQANCQKCQTRAFSRTMRLSSR